MKIIIYILIINIPFFLFGQNIKKQIGVSVWQKNNKTYIDSTTSYIIYFDEQGRKQKEWQIYLDSKGIITDTNSSILDTNGRMVEFYGSK
jgi:hypothetical protein